MEKVRILLVQYTRAGWRTPGIVQMGLDKTNTIFFFILYNFEEIQSFQEYIKY